jgi:hypothetical protein
MWYSLATPVGRQQTDLVFRVVHRLRGVGLIHGNVVRPPCFDVGEQRKQRHMFKQGVG